MMRPSLSGPPQKLLVATLLLCYVGITTSSTLAQVDSLYSTLFTGYNKKLFPLLNQNDTTYVGMVLYIININDFDEISGVISVSFSFAFQWTDERLSWISSSFGGKTHLYVAPEDIWFPQIYTIQAAERIEAIGNVTPPKMTLYSNGLIQWTPGKLVKFICSVDVTYFPYDVQNCMLEILPWGVLNSDLLLYAMFENISTAFYTENSEWELMTTTKLSNFSQDTDSKYVKLELHLKRRSTFYVIYIILPLTFLSILNCCVFLMPSNSGERLSVAVTIFLSFIVYMEIVNDNVPASSSPISLMYYNLLLLLIYSSLIMILCILSLRIYDKDDNDEPPSHNLGKLIGYLRFWCLARTETRVQDLLAVHDDNNKVFGTREEGSDTVGKVSDCVDLPCKDVTWKLVGQTFDMYCFVIMFLIHVVASVSMYVTLSDRTS